MELESLLDAINPDELVNRLLSALYLPQPNMIVAGKPQWRQKFEEAIKEFQAREYEKAFNLFHALHNKLVEAGHGTVTPALINASACAILMNRPGKAVELLQRTVNDAADINLWNLAAAYWRLPQRQVNAAIKRMQDFVEKGPKSRRAQALLILTALLLRERRRDEALKSLAEAWRLDPTFCQTTLGLTEMQQAEPQQPEAIRPIIERLRQLLIPRPPERYSGLSETHEAYPSFIQAIRFAGEDNLEAAFGVFQSLRRRYPQIPQFAWALASCYLVNGDATAAERLILSTGALSNIEVRALWNLACCQVQQSKWQDAEQTLQVIIERGAIGGVKAYLSLALIQVLLGKEGAARQTVQKGYQVSNKYPPTINAALTGLGLKRLLPSVALTPAKAEAAEAPPEWQNACTQAQSLYKQGNVADAADKFAALAPSSVQDTPEFTEWGFDCFIVETPTGILANDPDASEAFQRGVRAYNQGDYQVAISEFQEVQNSIPHEQCSLINLGAAQFKVGKRKEALRTLDIARRRTVYSGYVWHNLAVVQLEDGDTVGAMRSLQEARQFVDPHSFNYIALAAAAEKAPGQERVVCEALFQAARIEDKPSWELLALTLRYCRSCEDEGAIRALLRYILEGQPLRPGVRAPTPPIGCRYANKMQEAWNVFKLAGDFDSAVVYFHRVARWREKEVRQAGPAEIGRVAVRCANAHFFLGQAYLRTHDWFNAHAAFHRANNLLDRYRDSITENALASLYQRLAQTYMDEGHLFWAKKLLTRIPTSAWNPELRAIKRSLEERIKRETKYDADTYRRIRQALCSDEFRQVDSPRELEPYLEQVLQSLNKLAQLYPTALNLVNQWRELLKQLGQFHRLGLEERMEVIQTLQVQFNAVSDGINFDLPREVARDLRLLLWVTSQCLNWAIEHAQPSAYELEVYDQVAYYDEYGQAGLLVCIRNTGRSELKNIRITLRQDRSVFYIPEQATRRVETLRPDEEGWFDWVISLRSTPPPAKVNFEFEIRYSAPEVGERSRRERIRDVSMQPFSEHGVVYPASPLRPGLAGTLYGREQLLSQITQSINPNTGQRALYFLEGLRQVGKTSVLYFLPNYLKKKYQSKIAPCYINLDTAWPDDNVYKHLSSRIIRTLPSQAALKIGEVSSAHEFLDFVGKVCQAKGCELLLLMLDEFGKAVEKIEQGDLEVNFLGFLRGLFLDAEMPVGLIFVSSQPLDELKQLSCVRNELIWANVRRVEVGFLDRQSTIEAIRGPIQGTPVSFHEEAERRIFEETKGYPWHVQSMCNTLMSLLQERKRYYVIPNDVDEAIERVLSEDTLFTEGFCKRGRLDMTDETILFSFITHQAKEGKPGWEWVEWDAIRQKRPARLSESDLRTRLNTLCRKQLLEMRRGGQAYRIRTPLLARWLKRKKDMGESVVDIYVPPPPPPSTVVLSDDPASQVKELVSEIREKKRQLHNLEMSIHRDRTYRNEDLPEWETLPELVQSEEEWKRFILATWRVFVEDRQSQEALARYPDLEIECDKIRLRWNFAHHTPPTKNACDAEMDARSQHIGTTAPSKSEDWTRLQVGVLQDLKGALDLAIQQVAEETEPRPML